MTEGIKEKKREKRKSGKEEWIKGEVGSEGREKKRGKEGERKGGIKALKGVSDPALLGGVISNT